MGLPNLHHTLSIVFVLFLGVFGEAWEIADYPLTSNHGVVKRSYSYATPPPPSAQSPTYYTPPPKPPEPLPRAGMVCCISSTNSSCIMKPVGRCDVGFERTKNANHCNQLVVSRREYCNYCHPKYDLITNKRCVEDVGPACICRKTGNTIQVRHEATMNACLRHTCKFDMDPSQRFSFAYGKPLPGHCVPYHHCKTVGATTTGDWRRSTTLARCPTY